MSLPERPGWVFVVPGFDFISLLLALVLFTGVVARESFLEVKLPPSEFRGVRLSDENPVIVVVKEASPGPSFYLSGKRVRWEDLEGKIEAEAESRGTDLVGIRMDREVRVKDQQAVVDLVARLDLRVYLGVTSARKGEEGR